MNAKSCAVLLILAAAPLLSGCGKWSSAPVEVSSALQAAEPKDFPTQHAATLNVFPAEVELRGQDDRQSIIVQAVDQQGVTRDVTAAARLRLADPKLAQLDGQTLVPRADGQTRLLVKHAGQQVEVPVVVKDADQLRSVSFRLDVMPIFMKHGCNNGSCHGAARGKDGFHLSLFGYDPEGDYFRLTRQIIGRRVDLAVPAKSLMLQKATGAVQHTGGTLMNTSSEDYQTLLRWISAGAPNDTGDTPEPLGIELLPSKVVFSGQEPSQRAVVLARYSDGSVRDVTRHSLFMTNNEAIAKIGPDGVIKGGGRGGAFVFARFSKFTVGCEVIVLPTDSRFRWPDVAEHNYIDSLVFDKLRMLHMAPSELCTDEVFLRRVYLDLAGLSPSRKEYERFVLDSDPQKRAKLIDVLLERDEFDDVWAMKWGEMLRIRAANQAQYGRDAKAMWLYAAWVREQMARDRPLDKFVSELLTGSGSNLKSPPANLYTSTEQLTPQKTAEDIAQVFLGTRIQCAQCHNHPFDRWTMDDYYSFTSCFAGVNLKRGIEGREVIVYNENNKNTTEHPVDGRKLSPKFLGGEIPAVEGQDPRPALAAWLTAPENAAFRETMANVIWAHFFGRGIVEPVDDVRISNPPSNRELLQELGRRLADYRFDKKRLIRDICNSRTYQLSSSPNATNELDETSFSHSYVRRLRAEVLLDTISKVTETHDRFPQSPPGTRAVQIHSGSISNYFLTTFGRAPRESACSCEINREANLSQALHLVNGETITQKVAQSPVIRSLLSEKQPPEVIIEELYVRALSRKPTPDELSSLIEIVNEDLGDPQKLGQLARLQAQVDGNYRRNEEQLATLRTELERRRGEGQEAAALASLQSQIDNLDRRLIAQRQRYEASVAQLVYADILWGLFNSTEFAFNH